jgi:hypothetical protein
MQTSRQSIQWYFLCNGWAMVKGNLGQLKPIAPKCIPIDFWLLWPVYIYSKKFNFTIFYINFKNLKFS